MSVTSSWEKDRKWGPGFGVSWVRIMICALIFSEELLKGEAFGVEPGEWSEPGKWGECCMSMLDPAALPTTLAVVNTFCPG